VSEEPERRPDDEIVSPAERRAFGCLAEGCTGCLFEAATVAVLLLLGCWVI